MRAGHGLYLLAISLLMLGVVMVNSAGLSIDRSHSVTLQEILLGKPMMLAAMAVAAMFLASYLPVDRLYTSRGLASPVPWIVVTSVALLLVVHIPGIGREVNGARRWITFGPIGFQPSEIAKWGVLIVLAWHCARRAGVMHRLTTGFIPPMILIAIICALIATEDLGTAALIGTVGVCVLLAGGVRVWQAAMLLPIGLVGFAAAVLTSPYRINRLHAFIDAYQDPQGIGYHVLQSMTAVTGGGLAGRGLGNSIQKFGYLPEATTDFIFAIICEEMGAVGALLVICLYSGLLYFGLRVLRAATHPFTRLLGLGILLTIGLQALINLAVVTGTAPTKGIALPLLSAGGTGWILTAFCIGLLVAIERESTKQIELTAENAEKSKNQEVKKSKHQHESLESPCTSDPLIF